MRFRDDELNFNLDGEPFPDDDDEEGEAGEEGIEIDNFYLLQAITKLENIASNLAIVCQLHKDTQESLAKIYSETWAGLIERLAIKETKPNGGN